MDIRYQILADGGVWDLQTRTRILPSRSDPAWQAYQRWLTEGGTPLPADSTGQLDLDAAKAARCEEINMFAAGLRNAFVRGRSAGEMAAWALKVNEARNYTQSGDPLDAPMLAMTAGIRGIPLAALVDKVLEQAEPFSQAEAYIDGVRGRHCDAVLTLASVAEVLTYDWRTGWPDPPKE